MELQIGCFEYSMELEKAICCTIQQNQVKLNEYAYYVKRIKHWLKLYE